MKLMIILLFGLLNALSPLEFDDDSKLYYGPWYDRLHGDTISSIIQRVNHKPFSFFQSDFNLTSDCQPNEVESFFKQLDESGTNAIAFITLYPILGMDQVSDSAISQISSIIGQQISKGRRIFLRYGPEMNGNWFVFGRQPVAYIESWKKVVGAIRQASGNSRNLAIIWAPNAGAGYPWGGTITNLTPVLQPLDTNKDGIIDGRDDPYTPYYPGDEWVDWVGFSVYHFGERWPWEQNVLPIANKFEDLLSTPTFSLYDMFSGSSRSAKPFIISETAATFHLAVDGSNQVPDTGPGRLAIKKSWWEQYLNPAFKKKYPKIKAIGSFEFIKHEETTWRDFTQLGDTGTGINSPFGNDGGSKDGEVLEAFRNHLKTPEIDSMIIWSEKSNKTPESANSQKDKTSDAPSLKDFNRGLMSMIITLTVFKLFNVY